MIVLIRTELLALRTARGPWVLALIAILLTLGNALLPVIGAGQSGDPSIGTGGALLAVLGAISRGSAVCLILGVLAATRDFRHGTATATFLRSPRRVRVVIAKAAAAALVATGCGVLNIAVVLTVGLPSGAIQASMLNPDVLLRETGLLLAYPLYAVLGVGIGATLLYQPLAVVLPLAWLLFAESLLLHLAPKSWRPWSLDAVTAALANAGDYPHVLPVPAGGMALLGYAVLLVSLGAMRVARRDIT
jgi:ABC-2 type transport system permease protein